MSSLVLSIGVYSNSTTPFYSVPEYNFGVELFYSRSRTCAEKLPLEKRSLPHSSGTPERFKTSRKFSLEFENFSEVFGRFENFSKVFREVIVPLRIDAPEMSKLPRS